MGFVYLICDSGYDSMFKIGVTRQPIEKRIKQLQTGNGSEIFLVNYHKTEYPDPAFSVPNGSVWYVPPLLPHCAGIPEVPPVPSWSQARSPHSGSRPAQHRRRVLSPKKN